MNHFLFVSVAFAVGTSSPAFAQSCANPIEITFAGLLSGNTCNSTNQLPYLANGAITSLDNQDIYHLRVGDGTGIQLTLRPAAGLDGTLFACRNTCSASASCVAAADNGGAGAQETVELPPGPGDYYIVVGSVVSDSTVSDCGTYELYVAAPLDSAH